MLSKHKGPEAARRTCPCLAIRQSGRERSRGLRFSPLPTQRLVSSRLSMTSEARFPFALARFPMRPAVRQTVVMVIGRGDGFRAGCSDRIPSVLPSFKVCVLAVACFVFTPLTHQTQVLGTELPIKSTDRPADHQPHTLVSGNSWHGNLFCWTCVALPSETKCFLDRLLFYKMQKRPDKAN